MMVLQNVNDLRLRNSSSSHLPIYSLTASSWIFTHLPQSDREIILWNPQRVLLGVGSLKNLLSLNVISFAAFVGVPLCRLYPLVSVCVYVSVTPARGADAFSWDGRL